MHKRTDPRLQNLVEGAQTHVKAPGFASARTARRMAGFTEYEKWREKNLATDEDRPVTGAPEAEKGAEPQS